MKVVFLGTSAGWPLPRLGCSCLICKSSDLKDKRLRPVVLIEDRILIDAGLDIYHQLRRYEKESGWEIGKLKEVLITHAHFDHFLGIWDLLKIYNLKEKVTITSFKKVLREIRNYFGIYLTNVRQRVVNEGESFLSGDLKISFFQVEHGAGLSYGIKIKERKIFCYIADFSRIRPSSKKIIKGADTAVFDGSSFDKRGQSKGHISMIEGVKIAKELKIKTVYFTHIGHKTKRHREMEEYFQSLGNFVKIAYDGLEIEV